MASGSPSSRRQIPATAAWFASVSANPGTTRAARSANNRTAGNSPRCAGVSGCPGSGAPSGGTGSTVSPVMFSASRLVASTRSPARGAQQQVGQLGHRVHQVLAVIQHQQQLPARQVVRQRRFRRKAARSCRPSAPAMAWATSASSRSWSSRTSHTPPGNARASPAAARSASRVLPTPPTPVSVTSRDPASSRLTSASSPRRPTKLVSSAGRFPVTRAPGAITHQRPGSEARDRRRRVR